jgi:transposase
MAEEELGGDDVDTSLNTSQLKICSNEEGKLASNVVTPIHKPLKKKSYNLELKAKAAELRKNNMSFQQIADSLGCKKSSVRDWINQSEEIESHLISGSGKNKRLKGAGCKLVDESIEKSMLEWISNQRANQNLVSYWRMLVFARSLPNPNKLKFSHGWLFNFMKRNKLSYRKRTTSIIVDQKIVKEGIDRFFNSFIHFMAENPHLTIIANVDETRIEKDMLGEKTIEMKGSNSVPIRTTNSERIGKLIDLFIGYTVILCTLSNGYKFSPLIIFDGTGVRIIKSLVVPSNVEIIFSGKKRNTFSSESIFDHWIKNIYLKELPSEIRHQTVLILDNSGTHNSLKTYITKIPHRFLPENSTAKLQPLDLTVNNRFKNYVRNMWEEWMASNYNSTEMGYYRAPVRADLLRWVSESWKLITREAIISGYEKFNSQLKEYADRIIEQVQIENEMSDYYSVSDSSEDSS